jgi:Xaa-Pro aminopeptidase
MISAPVEWLESRHQALVHRLSTAGVDALLVTHRPNVLYLSYFSGSSGWLLVERDRLTLLSDARSTSRCQAERRSRSDWSRFW